MVLHRLLGVDYEGNRFWAQKSNRKGLYPLRFLGPSGESRTHGLLNPIQARYQTALHPDIAAVFSGKQYYN